MTLDSRDWLRNEEVGTLEDARRLTAAAGDATRTPDERERSRFLAWAAVFDLFAIWSLRLRAWADDPENAGSLR